MGSSTVLVLVICVMALQLAQLSNAQNTPDDFVRAHNSARAQVGVGPVSWDNTVASYARSYANQQQKDYCKPVHSSGPYGENISWAFGKAWTATDAVNSWVSEKQYYNYTTNTCAAGKVCGQYTQVVWEDSVRIGCARVVCNYGAIFISCNYDPPGNYVGQWPYSSPLLANI